MDQIDLFEHRADNALGVKRIEAISSQLGVKGRALLFFGVFVFAWAYNLDSVSGAWSEDQNACADKT